MCFFFAARQTAIRLSTRHTRNAQLFDGVFIRFVLNLNVSCLSLSLPCANDQTRPTCCLSLWKRKTDDDEVGYFLLVLEPIKVYRLSDKRVNGETRKGERESSSSRRVNSAVIGRIQRENHPSFLLLTYRFLLARRCPSRLSSPHTQV